MKKLITLLTIFFAVLSTTIYAQSQPYFNYQAVIRDNTGGLLINRLVNLKIAIREGNATGTISYQEVHTTTTNAFGLVNLVVGAGAPLQGSMPAVNWGDDTHFIDIELDANNTGVYTQMGATQILSVPYALNARTVEFNDDADADPTNEIQQFVLQNNVLYLDNGGNFVNLNPYLDNTDNQVISVFDSTTTIRNMLISGGNKVTFSVADIDNDSINELQTVFMLNDTLYLSRGGFIDLKPYLDNTDEQNLSLSNDTLVITGSNDTISLSEYRQNITLTNDTLFVSGSNDTISLVPYLDNTDEQNLTLLNDTLVITGSNDTISLSEFRQELSLSNDTLMLSGSNFVVLPPDSDGDSTNEIQTLSLVNDTLYLDLSGDTLDLTSYLDNTDEQTLSLLNDTLVISGSNDTISLVPYLDNTDEQNLTLLNDTLVITGSNDTIPLSEFRQELSLSNDTLMLSGSNFVVLPPDSDGDSANEIQTLSFSNDTLILSLSEDTIDLSGYSLRIDTNSSDIASLYIELDDDSLYFDSLISDNSTLIEDLEIRVTNDSTNFDTLISDLSAAQEMADSMIYAKIASDSTNFDTLVSMNASGISALENRVTSDSTNFDTLISNLFVALSDTASDFRTALGQTTSDLSDTASALRSTIVDSTMSAKTYAMMLSSTDSNVVHSALVDTSSDIRGTISSTRTALLANAKSVSSADSSVVHSALVDTSLDIRGTISSTRTALLANAKSVSSADSNVVHSALVDTSSDIRGTISSTRTALLANAKSVSSADSNAVHSALVDTSNDIRGTISSTRTALLANAKSVSSADSNVVHSALADTASALRNAIGAGGGGTDDQNLSLTNSNRSLSIESGNTLDIRPLSDSAMSALSDTASVLRTLIGAAGDDLGNHTATTNIQLGGNSLSNDGDSEGISIDNNGKVTVTSLNVNSAFDLPTADGTAGQVLQTDGAGNVTFETASGVTNEHLRNKLDTVTEFLYVSFDLDASNDFYIPIHGINENTSISDLAVGLVAPFNGEVISYSIRADTDLGVTFGFGVFVAYHQNLNTSSLSSTSMGVITLGTSKKVALTGLFSTRDFSQGDLLHFKFTAPVDAATGQKVYLTIELNYFR